MSNKQSSFYPCIIWYCCKLKYAIIYSRYDFPIDETIRIIKTDATEEDFKHYNLWTERT